MRSQEQKTEKLWHLTSPFVFIKFDFRAKARITLYPDQEKQERLFQMQKLRQPHFFDKRDMQI